MICSQTFISLIEHIQKLEILYEFDVRFHTKARMSNLSCFTDWTKQASAGALIHRQQTIHWTFTQTKLSSIYRQTFCHLFGLEETSIVAYNLGKTQTCNYFFYFSVAKTLPKSSRACGKRRKILKFWNAAISKYIQLVFSCVMEELLIFYIYEI